MKKTLDSELILKVRGFPQAPGVYIMKDHEGKILYIGKAVNVRSRVLQYLSGHDERFQIKFLLGRLRDIEFMQTHSELEALLVENSLIKKHKPRYNIFLKDDKSYLGLKLTVQDNYPRLIATRRVKKDGALYYGPFSSALSLREVKDFLEQYFLLRTCSDTEMQNRSRPCLEYQMKRCSAPCVGYVDQTSYQRQIQSVRDFLEGRNDHLQSLVTDKIQIASSQQEYEEAARLRDLLQGMKMVLEKQNVSSLTFDFMDVIALQKSEKRTAIAVLMVREAQVIDSKYHVFKNIFGEEELLSSFMMQYYSENAFIPSRIIVSIEMPDRDLIMEIFRKRFGRDIVVDTPRSESERQLLELASVNLQSHFSRSDFEEISRQKILQGLSRLLHLSKIPNRIECYDISNTSGTNAVGSLVLFVDGEADKSGYKKFKIKKKSTPDDFAMLEEVFTRRFKRSEGDWVKPDLIVVDGGLGQLSRLKKVLADLKIVDVDTIAIAKGSGGGARAKGIWQAKKEEEIYLPQRKNPVILKRGSAELMLLQRIRDEAHRFAIAYHRLLRQKTMTK